MIDVRNTNRKMNSDIFVLFPKENDAEDEDKSGVLYDEVYGKCGYI